MKKTLIYGLLIFLAIWFISKKFGFISAATVALIFIAITLYNRRATLLTRFASQAYFINGNVEKADKLYKKAYKTGLMDASCKTSYSAFCLRENRFEKGRRLLNEVINSSRTADTERENAKHNLAILTWKEGNLEEAIKIMEEVHTKVPATNTYGSLGVLYLERAKENTSYSDCLDFMREAYDYNNSDKTIADNLGELYLNLGEYEEAKKIYDILLTTSLITPMPYYNYGRVLKNLGDTDGARENFEKALTCRFTSVLTVTREMIQQEIDSL